MLISLKKNKMYNIIVLQYNTRLTLIGKITVIKTLLASRLFLVLSQLATNSKYIKLIQNDLYNFLRNGKGDKIKRSKIRCRWRFEMPNLTTFGKSFKVRWVQNYLNNGKQ